MRRNNLSWLHGLMGIGAVVFLTGADGGGCTPEEPPPPEEPACPPGEHLELVCDPEVCMGQGCIEMCVPDSPCPEGTYEEWVCDDPVSMEDPQAPESICVDPNGCPPEPGGCYPICIPVNPCEPGSHEEWVCQSEPCDPMLQNCEPTQPPCEDPMSQNCEPPPEECYPICVPDMCEPGTHEEWVCEPVYYEEQTICVDPMGCPPPPEECYPVCVPDCQWVCDENMNCWEECGYITFGFGEKKEEPQ